MERESTQVVIERLLQARPVLSTRDVAEQARVSRQAAQKTLRSWVAAGKLTVEGKARAARYYRVEAGSRFDNSTTGQWGAPPSPAALVDDGVDDPFPIPQRRVDDSSIGPPVLQVASAGSLYRLSARILLSDVPAGRVRIDFTGVMDLGDEFLEEVFRIWAPAHPSVRLEVVNVPAALRSQVASALPAPGVG